MAAGSITVRVLGDASQFKRTIADVDGTTSKLGSKLNGFGSTLKSAMLPGFAAVGAAAVAFGASSISAFAESEAAQNKLQAAFAKFPQLANGNIEALRSLNTELAKKTKFDDDATAAAQAQLAQFNLTQQQLVQLTPLVQDYAARTGKDLVTAAQDVGKAIQGKGRALQSVGLNLKDTGDAATNYQNVVAGLSAQVGGFAEKEGATMSGRMEIMRNQFGEVQEKLGSALMPALMGLTNFTVETLIPAIESTVSWLSDFGARVGELASSVWAAMKRIGEIVGSTFTWVREHFNHLMLALGPLGVAIILLKEHWETAFNGIKSVVQTVWRIIEPILGKIMSAVDKVAGAVGKIGGAIGKVGGAVGGAIGKIPGFAGGVNNFSGGLAVVGERGPELVRLPSGSDVIPNHRLGGSVTVHVHQYPGQSPDSVVDAIATYVRRNGGLGGLGLV